MNRIRYALLLLFISLLVGCSTLQHVDGEQLLSGIEASAADETVSWWYLGETDSYYLVARKSPDKTSSYRVKKSEVAITVPITFWPGTKEPVRLKKENIKPREE